MLYILPPPSAPSPPSPWTTILCSGGSGNSGVNYKGVPTKTVVQSASWPTVNSKKKPPPVLRNHGFKIRVSRDSGAGGSAEDEEVAARNSRSLSECYFAGKGAAVVLPPHERARPSRRVSASGSDIQQHLQSMFYLLRPEETLKMAVKLESVHSGRTRYLVVVSCVGRQDAEESCLLGIDCNEKTTVGLVLRVLADTAIRLDGDGGFSVSVCGRQHIFKPVSVQAMWSALQTLHKVSSKAREQNYFLGGLSHDWVSYYEQRIESDRSCLNEWHAMDSIESRRPPSPDSVRTKPQERTETERVIRCKLKEIMMSVDLDEVTSKYIRGRLEEDLDMDLGEFKSFIDQEMLTILGQMDAATEIFDHVYLGSEWNASNLEELQKNGVLHILNVTREIDNFFPGMFDYFNVRVYDDEKTDLLKHWDNTFKYITRARKEGSKVLVHCKMGVSRSASVVIAYAMKAFNWDFKKAFDHVKEKRSCIKPNTSFISQLETYQGILDAMKNREKLQRSKSETNLKSPGLVAKAEQRSGPISDMNADLEPSERLLGVEWALQTRVSGQELSRLGGRPKSWSPDNTVCSTLHLGSNPTSVSLEQLNPLPNSPPLPPPPPPPLTPLPESRNHNPNVRMPCGNGQAYSVSQNKVVYLPASCKKSQETEETPIPSVKHRVNELESQSQGLPTNGRKTVLDRKGLVLNLTTQFEPPATEVECPSSATSSEVEDPMMSQTKLAPQMLTAILVKKEIWDPGDGESPTTCTTVPPTSTDCTSPLWTSSSVLETPVPELSNNSEGTTFISEFKLKDNDTNAQTVSSKASVSMALSVASRTVTRKEGDPFSAQLDRVFDREERKTLPSVVPPTLPCVTEVLSEVSSDVSSEALSRECPSRQSSWSSYDSAVVLGYQGEPRDAPSRQSSWGSADTRFGTLPSRNSSWGSYDMRPSIRTEKQTLIDDFRSSSSGMFPYDRDEIPWYHGTVKRTKQKLEEGTGTVKRVCQDTQQVIEPMPPYINASDSPSPHRTADGTVNYKIHGPRPYQSPSADKVLSGTGFTYPCSVSNETSGHPFDELSSNLTHYSSSPTLSSCHEKISLKKMASSQPNITFNADSLCAILNKSDFPSVESNFTSSPDSSRSLSVSAPTPSTLSLMNKTETLSHPSTSLPAMAVVHPLEIPIPISCTFQNETPSPCIISSTIDMCVKDQKKVLENVTNIVSPVLINRCSSVDNSKDNSSPPRSPEADSQKSISGLVRNLKKEFEAKSLITDKSTNSLESGENESKKSDKLKSLPPSPVSTYPDIKSPPGVLSPSTAAEDLSVKVLVGKYEVSKTLPPGVQPGTRTRLASENETVHRRAHAQQKSSLPQRKSSLDIASIRNGVQPQPVIKHSLPVLVNNLKNGCNVTNKRTVDVTNTPSGGGDEFRKPPIPPVVRSMGPSPSVVVASVVAKANSKKQQQGKTHPLARLTIKPRHNNPVYNTM